MKVFSDERGQTIVFVAISMMMLMGFVAVAVDVGLLFRARRNMQIAADAAAIAGALDYLYKGDVSSAVSAAQAAAATNGVTNGSDGAVVNVNCAPTSGPNAGSGSCNGFFEAIVSTPNPTFFMRLYKFSSVNVAARAVAGTPVTGNACIWITDPTASGAFTMQGSATINLTNCGVYVNSNSSSAAIFTGNGYTFNASSLDIVGGCSGSGICPSSTATGVVPEVPSIGTDITGPSLSACTSTNTVTAGTVTTATVIPSASNGVVCFSASNVVLSNGVTLPGSSGGTVYLFEDGVTIATGATVSVGSATYDSSTQTFSDTYGATIDLYGVGSSAGTLDQKSNSVLNVYAPTSGAYNSIAIMEPPSNTTTLQVQFGSNNQVLDGIIYAPKAEVYLQDNGGGVTASGVIADRMFIKSSTFSMFGYSSANQSTTPFKIVTLVE